SSTRRLARMPGAGRRAARAGRSMIRNWGHVRKSGPLLFHLRSRPLVSPSRSLPMTSPRYCILTPCRNEEKYARRTLQSVVGQVEPPELWIIVDDGSTDATPRILEEYAARHAFIRV